jgi:hypothetical protein
MTTRTDPPRPAELGPRAHPAPPPRRPTGRRARAPAGASPMRRRSAGAHGRVRRRRAQPRAAQRPGRTGRRRIVGGRVSGRLRRRVAAARPGTHRMGRDRRRPVRPRAPGCARRSRRLAVQPRGVRDRRDADAAIGVWSDRIALVRDELADLGIRPGGRSVPSKASLAGNRTPGAAAPAAAARRYDAI